MLRPDDQPARGVATRGLAVRLLFLAVVQQAGRFTGVRIHTLTGQRRQRDALVGRAEDVAEIAQHVAAHTVQRGCGVAILDRRQTLAVGQRAQRDEAGTAPAALQAEECGRAVGDLQRPVSQEQVEKGPLVVHGAASRRVCAVPGGRSGYGAPRPGRRRSAACAPMRTPGPSRSLRPPRRRRAPAWPSRSPATPCSARRP